MNIEKTFLAIWHRALNLDSLDDLNPSLVKSWAEQKRLIVKNCEETDVGVFQKTKSIVLTTEGGQACFPKVSHLGNDEWKRQKEAIDRDLSTWDKMEWFFPLWIPIGRVKKLLRDTEHRPREEAINLFNYHTSTLYTLPFQAVCVAQIIPNSESLRDFASIAREAYLAFYSGHRASSIAALIPTIEGALTRIFSDDKSNLSPQEKISKIFDKSIKKASRIYFNDMWAPRQYETSEYLICLDERVLFFETFRRWLLNSFFKHTKEYDGITWLNRHLFAHAESSEWQNSGNFCRLIVALATLGVVETWYRDTVGASLFFPDMNEDGELLWQQAMLQAKAQIIIKSIEAEKYHKEGRIVPEMPTDDGILLRKAILSQDCINDLVRPLRSAGWSVTVGEPDERALYIKIVATSGDSQIKAALLYSCATENSIYRKLSEDSDLILYRGSPYKQDSFAYGLTIHVGPVTGWQPPAAPAH